MAMTRERATALMSALVAIALLGAAVTAQSSRSRSGDQLTRLESDLRYQLELGARVDRPAFEVGTKALESALVAWRKSPQSAGDHEVMTAWLRAALLRSLPGESGAWPATPEFSSAHVARKEVAADEREQRPKAEGRRTKRAVADADSAPKKDVAGLKAGSSADKTPSRKTQEPNEKSGIFAQDVDLSDLHRQANRVGANKNESNQPPAAPETSIVARQASVKTPVPEVGKRSAPTAAEAAKTYRDVGPEEKAAKPQAAAVEVNLGELNARIGGYHDGLGEIEAALVAGREGMTLEQVGELVTRLEELAGQSQFVRLYYDALRPEEGHFVMTPRSMAETVEMVDQQRARLEAVEEDHFATTNEPGGNDLARRLKALREMASE
jgi:hypothetical protein